MVAVDDILFEDCSWEGEEPTCPGNEFLCKNEASGHSRCINVWEVCDHKHDCDDGADEMDCATTTVSLKQEEYISAHSWLKGFFVIQGECEFDVAGQQALCGWKSLETIGSSPDLKWKVNDKSSHEGGPIGDHTPTQAGSDVFFTDSIVKCAVFNVYKSAHWWLIDDDT